MKPDRFSYLYLMFGAVLGFLAGSSIGGETAMLFRRMLFALVILFVAFSWRRLEARAHQKHLEHWDEIEAAGRWKFILTQYVAVRGGALFILLVAPFFSTLRPAGAVVGILAICALFLVAVLVYFGMEEWSECEQEMEILALRQTGEFITSQQN